jgi:hypothetical protein
MRSQKINVGLSEKWGTNRGWKTGLPNLKNGRNTGILVGSLPEPFKT